MSFPLIARIFPVLLFTALTVSSAAAQTAGRTRNVIFVMTDGLRWQEVFQGADPALMNKESGVPDVEALKREYWRDTPAARREALLPFLWSVVARNGQIYGNRDAGSDAYLTNGLNFSYPGYSETLCGFADPRVDSNDPTPNPNVTVLEWLHNKPAYRGKVAAFGAWNVISAIVNAGRAGFPVNAGYDPYTVPPSSPRMELLNRLKEETRVWNAEPFDAFTFHTALEHLKQHKPRVLFLSLGETDEWSHDGRYALYLKSAARVDGHLKELWETVQSMPEYRGTTSLVFAVDHGRGRAPVEWRSHGQKVPESKYVWMAFMGPGIPALGERKDAPAVTQSQIAATVAALLGEDYSGDVQKAGKPIADVLPR